MCLFHKWETDNEYDVTEGRIQLILTAVKMHYYNCKREDHRPRILDAFKASDHYNIF